MIASLAAEWNASVLLERVKALLLRLIKGTRHEPPQVKDSY